MVVSLAQVLDLDVVQRAAPSVAHGQHLLDREVRWVHTSELVEAAALLKGGELLLTTGLGLAGRGPVAQRAYVDELADRGAAALALELGWTFQEVPQALLDAARRRDLPVIALHEIIPFVEITEAVQRQLLQEDVAQLTLERHVTRLLHDLLLRGEGLTALVEALADLLSCPVVLEDLAGAVVAQGGGRQGRAGLEEASEVRSSSVDLLGHAWGELHAIDPPRTARAVVPLALEAGAAAVAMTLLRGSPPPLTRIRLHQEFMQDLVAGRFRTPADTAIAAAGQGLHVDGQTTLTGFAIGGYRAADAQVLLQAAERAAAAVGPSVVAEVDGSLLGVVQATHSRDGQQSVRPLLEDIDAFARRRAAGRPSRLALGPTVSGARSLSRTVRDARAALLLADQLLLPERIVSARGMVADRLLAKVVEDRHLADVVDDVLGPILEHDAGHGTDLVETLYVHLCHGDSKSAAADVLHIRRQTLYKRLARIEALIGDLQDPDWRVSLLVALRAHRLLGRRPRSATAGS
jgi:PucR family transcriptional regulator, purine catabolism regulatory protein